MKLEQMVGRMYIRKQSADDSWSKNVQMFDND